VVFYERSHSLLRPEKNSHFIGLQNVTTFVWYPTILTENLWYRDIFGAPLSDCPPKNTWFGSTTGYNIITKAKQTVSNVSVLQL